jgi:hypothetical protein
LKFLFCFNIINVNRTKGIVAVINKNNLILELVKKLTISKYNEYNGSLDARLILLISKEFHDKYSGIYLSKSIPMFCERNPDNMIKGIKDINTLRKFIF